MFFIVSEINLSIKQLGRSINTFTNQSVKYDITRKFLSANLFLSSYFTLTRYQGQTSMDFKRALTMTLVHQEKAKMVTMKAVRRVLFMLWYRVRKVTLSLTDLLHNPCTQVFQIKIS